METIASLASALQALPQCLRWLVSNGKGDDSACPALLRPDMLSRIEWPENVRPDDHDSPSDYLNDSLDGEQPNAYLSERIGKAKRAA